MSAISWVETTPNPASDASSGNDELLSLMSSIALGLQPSILWPGSGGGSLASAGQFNFGTARLPVVAGGGPPAAPGTADGFLFYNNVSGFLYHAGSLVVTALGNRDTLEHAAGSGSGTLSYPQTSRWLIQTGSFTTGDGVSTTTFPTPYLGTPAFVMVTPTSGTPLVSVVYSPTSSGFSSLISRTGGTASFTWLSEGTASF